MTSPLAAIDSIFSRHRDAAAVLFLIEDSADMISLWPHLRDSYLPSLLSVIKVANLSAAAEALWMTASEHAPVKHHFDPSAHRMLSWDNIPRLKFSSHSENTISPANVTRAIEALSATFGHGPATRHLVVVAALNPSANELGPRGTQAWSTAVERLHQEEIRLHLIVRSQPAMDGLTPLYWDLISKGSAYESFTDDTRFALYLCDFHGATDKGKTSAANNQRVPNSGLRSTSSSMPPSDQPSLVYRIQKMNGMEKKRRSKTRRDQITTNKPGEPYQKSRPQTRHNPSTTQLASLDTSGHSLPQRKSTSRTSKVEAFPSYLDPRLPNPIWDERRSLYSSTTAPFWSSSPSPHYPIAGAFSSPDLRNFGPSQMSLPTSTVIQSPHMGLGSQSTPMISPDGSHWETQFHGVCGPDPLFWNDHDIEQGQQIGSSTCPPSSTSHSHDLFAPRSAHQPEQIHNYEIPSAGNPSGSHFNQNSEDRMVHASPHDPFASRSSGGGPFDIYLLPDRFSGGGPHLRR